MLYKLLRCACLHCFHLKMPRKEVDRFRQRLTLLQQVHSSVAKPIIAVLPAF